MLQRPYLDTVLDCFDKINCSSVITLLPTGLCPISSTAMEYAKAKDFTYVQVVGIIT
jgi:hypothetical protein